MPHRVVEETDKYVLVEESVSDILLEESEFITLADIASDKARMVLPTQAKIDLAHMGGAPFLEQDENAILSPLQQEILDRPEREIIVFGGSRVGKSVIAGVLGFLHLCIPNTKIAIVGMTYNHAQKEFDYLYRMFLSVFGPDAAKDMSNISRGNQNNMFIDTIWNSSVKTYSVGINDLDAVMGEEFDVVILAEGAKIPFLVVKNKLYRALRGRAKYIPSLDYTRKTGYTYGFTTPAGEDGYTFEKWSHQNKKTNGNLAGLQVDGTYVDPQTGQTKRVFWFNSFYFREASVLENPAFSKEEYDALIIEHGGENTPDFQEQVLGRVVKRSGAVFSNFDLDSCTVADPSPEHVQAMTLGFGQDVGTNYAGLVAGVDRKGNYYILDEVYTNNRTTKDNSEMLIMACTNVVRRSRSEPELATVDQIDFEKWKELHETRFEYKFTDIRGQNNPDYEQHLRCSLGASNLNVEPTLNRLNELFGEGRLFVARRCTNLIDEIRRLTWDKKNDSKTTRGQPDHAVDAMRYLITPMLHHEAVNAPKPRSFEEAYWEDHGVARVVQQMKEDYTNPPPDRGGWWDWE